jgi:hypothetical protein
MIPGARWRVCIPGVAWLLLATCGCSALSPAPVSPTPSLPAATVAALPGPVHRQHLQLGLAQGSESLDPAFLHDTIPLIRPLGVRYVRVDNIYNYPGVVDLRAGGGLAYNWAPLDTLVDDIRAMGAEPFLDLSYMPPALNPESRLLPPRNWPDWAKLVNTTVRHFNGDRGLGLHYWEVWNEPNLWGAWQGSYPQYLELYDQARRAIEDRDPHAVVGGPALSLYEETALDWLLGFESQQTDGGAVGFLSWHAYGWTPAQMAAQTTAARALAARKRPGAPLELMITEVGVRTGGPGDTSVDNQADTPTAAVHLLASIQALEAAGLDKLFVFELRDGPHAGGEFWGRFGILTNHLHPKPIYHALRAYAQLGPDLLPVQVTPPRDDLGLLVAPSGRAILWYSGTTALHVSVRLPAAAGPQVQATLFDAQHNNPAAGAGGDTPAALGTFATATLAFDLAPDSVVLLDPVGDDGL